MQKGIKKGIGIIWAVFILAISVMPVSAAGISQDNSGLYGEFNCIDGGTLTTQSAGKPKILVFFTTTCSNCRGTLQNISQSEWIRNGETDVCAIEMGGQSADEVTRFRDTYCPEGMIQFGADPGDPTNLASRRMAYSYYMEINLTGGSYATPLIAMIDADNKLQYVITGYQSSETIGKYVDDLRPSEGNAPGGSGQPDSVPGQGGEEKTEGSVTDNIGNTENTGYREGDPGSWETGAASVVCDHEGGFTVISDATATSDAIGAYQCVKCGAVYKYEAVPNSAFGSFLDETADRILNAKQEEVVIDTKLWVSFNRTVFEAMRSRPDVTVTVNYMYEGNSYVLTIPAGTDVDLLMDENGFGGFRYIEKVLNNS